MKKDKLTAILISAALGVTASFPSALPAVSVYAADSKITYSFGDVNGDKIINAVDASIVLQEYSAASTGKDSLLNDSQKKAADINKNGNIEASDASLILSYYSYASTGGEESLEKYLESLNNTPPTSSTTTASATTTAKTTTNTAKTTTTTTDTASTTKSTKTTSKTTASTTNSASTTNTATSASTSSTTKSTSKTTSSATSSTSKTTASTTNSTTVSTTTSAESTTTTTENPNKVSEIRLNRTVCNINVGESDYAAIITMLPATAPDKSEIWSSSDEKVAITDNNGWITGIGEGSCVITVKSADNPEVYAEITVNVTDTSSVKEIRLSRKTATIQAGYSDLAARVEMFPQTAINKNEIWSSSDEEIAIVDNVGWVTAKKAGNCIITVKSESNPAVFDMILITVVDGNITSSSTTSSTTISTTVSSDTSTTTTTASNVKVTEIVLSKYEMTIPVGKTDIAYVDVLPYDATNKAEIWVSSDENIATVGEYGWVKGVSEGECVITVYSVSDPAVHAEIAVKVVPAGTPYEPTKINFSHVVGELSTDKYLAFYTPFPENAKGEYEIEYEITDENGNKKTEKSVILFLPDMDFVVTRLSADTNSFLVATYLTNLHTNERVKIGDYWLTLSPRNAKTFAENITNAFATLGAFNE